MRAPARFYPRLIALAACVLLLLPARAWAWVEWHHLGDSVRLTLGNDGSAVIETTSRYDVMRGPIKTFDVQGIDADAKVDADLTVTRLAAAPLGAGSAEGDALGDYRGHVEPLPKRPDAAYEGQAMRLVMDGESGAKAKLGVPRGAYAITWRYRIDAASAARWFTREGSRLRLIFQGTSAPEGYDSARLLVVVPTSPEPPRLAPLPWGATVAALRRGPGEDELELVRPHVARAEAPRFAVDLDSRLLPLAPRPELRPAAQAPIAPKTREHVTWVLFGAAAGLLAFWLVRLSPSGLIRSRITTERAVLAGVVAAVSVGVEAFVGLEWALLLAPVLLALSLTRGASPHAAWWKALLAALVLVALVTATHWLAGPCPAASAAARAFALLPAVVALCPDSDKRLLTAVRLAVSERAGTDLSLDWAQRGGVLRLVAKPNHALEGFVGLELGKTRAGISSLVRVQRGSVAEARLRSLWPTAVSRPGRSEGELAYVLFAPTCRIGTLCRAVVLMGPAFGERRQQQAAVLAERRRAPAAPRSGLAWT